jgi:hypothetical protein
LIRGSDVGSPVTSRFFSQPGNPAGQLTIGQMQAEIIRMQATVAPDLPAQLIQQIKDAVAV